MSQQYQRVTFADFMRDAARIFDGIEARGETVLVERGGKTFVITAWQAYRKRTPSRPQPPNMQDSLWSIGRQGASPGSGSDAAAHGNGRAESPDQRGPQAQRDEPGAGD